MNIILEKRETIIQDNNTAQQQLLNILENTPKSTVELYLPQEFHGDLDFSVLTSMGMGKVNTITLGKGEITTIVNLPQGILNLNCADNYLFDLDELPRSLKTLNVSHNYLKTLDFTRLDKLENLNISHNHFKVLEKLPSSLIEIKCDNNDLTRIDLEGIENLTVLHANNNKITLVNSLPDGIVDMQMENNPYSIQFRNSSDAGISLLTNQEENIDKDDNIRRNYTDALNRYFKLKSDYETKLHKMRTTAYYKTVGSKSQKRAAALSVQPPCIKCKQAGGTIFSKRYNRHKAICGNAKSPCSLNIEIFTGAIGPIHYLLDIHNEETMDLKDMIIQQKLDTLFNYVNEEKSVKLFKKELEAYNANSKVYSELLEEYNNCFFNPTKKEEAKKKQEAIFYAKEKIQALLQKYEETQNKDVLEKAVRIQIDELLPATVELRRLRNETNMVVKKVSQFAATEYRLFQYPCNIDDLDHVTGEPPRVIRFSQI